MYIIIPGVILVVYKHYVHIFIYIYYNIIHHNIYIYIYICNKYKLLLTVMAIAVLIKINKKDTRFLNI